MPSPIDMMRADFGDVDVDGEAANLVADDLGDLFGFDVHGVCTCRYCADSISDRFNFSSCVVTLPS